jgi:hypothetical protein
MKLRTQLLTEQQALVRRLHKEEGMSYREIAEGLLLSRGRVGQIAAEARRRLKEYEDADPRESFVGLPVRVRKILEEYLEFHSRSEVLAAVKSGRLYYDAKEPRNWRYFEETKRTRINVAWLRNAGWHSWEILLQWLGLETAAEQEQRAEAKRKKSPPPPPQDSLAGQGSMGRRVCPICGKKLPAQEMAAHLAEHWRAHTVAE